MLVGAEPDGDWFRVAPWDGRRGVPVDLLAGLFLVELGREVGLVAPRVEPTREARLPIVPETVGLPAPTRDPSLGTTAGPTSVLGTLGASAFDGLAVLRLAVVDGDRAWPLFASPRRSDSAFGALRTTRPVGEVRPAWEAALDDRWLSAGVPDRCALARVAEG
ncbi:MAG: hypothetical protein OXN89_20030 [Bryobacterales bacterium]|nr:hypothetical protein [Bryobacterales bacterium]